MLIKNLTKKYEDKVVVDNVSFEIPKGAVISEFSTRSTDETDVFTDKTLVRETKIED